MAKKKKDVRQKLTDEEIQAIIDKEESTIQTKKYSIKRSKYLHKYDCCFFCSSKKDIEMHHIYPDENDWRVKWNAPNDKIENELKKCVPLCYECHKKLHDMYRLKPAKHGTAYSYFAYDCRCDECVKAMKAAVKAEKRKIRELGLRVTNLEKFKDPSNHDYKLNESGKVMIDKEGIKKIVGDIIESRKLKRQGANGARV